MALFDFFRKRNPNPGAEMSFVDHLEDLRWHVIRSVIAVLIGAIVVFIYARELVDGILFAPADPDFVTYSWFCDLSHALGIGDVLCLSGIEARFQSNTMTGQFISTFTIALIGGFIIAFPYVFWEFWKFIRPALSEREAKKTKGVVFWVSTLFFSGVLFGYFILTPFMINFYFSYSLSDKITILPNFSDYIENLVYTTVGIGILFQMPLLMMLLTRIGFISAAFLKKYRRHAFVVILIAAAIITPSTDPFSLAIVTIPLYLLFEASIVLSARVGRKQKTEEWS